MGTIANLMIKIGADTSGAVNGFNQMDRVATQSCGRFKSNTSQNIIEFGKFVSGVATGGLLVNGTFGKMASAGLNYNASLENSQVAWTTLLGSQEKSTQMLKDIEAFAANTPFEKMGVDQMAKYLNNAGLEGQGLFDQLTKFGDMGGAFNVQQAGLEEMVRQYAQVKQAGVAYTEDLNIVQDKGIPIYKALSETLGISTADVKKWASEGKISADMYQTAMDKVAEGVKGGMAAQSQTFTGMISTLKDTLGQFAGLMAADMFDGLKSGLETILPIISSAVEAFGEGGMIAAILDFRKGLRDAFGEDAVAPIIGFIDIITGIGMAIKGIITGDEEAIFTAFADWLNLGAGAAGILTDALLFTRDSVIAVFGWIRDNGEIIKAIIIGFTTSFLAYKTAMMVVHTAQSLVNTVMMITNAIMMANPIALVILAVIAFGAALIYLWNTNEGFRIAITNVFNTIKTVIVGVINGVIAMFSVWVSSITGAWNTIVSTATNAWNNVKTTIENVLNTIKSVWEGCMAFLKGINLFEIGKSIIQGLINGIKNMATGALNAVKGVVTGAIDAAKKLLGIKSPSRVFMGLGDNIGKGLAIGIGKTEGMVNGAISDLSKAAVGGFNVSLRGNALPSVPSQPKTQSGGIVVNIENFHNNTDKDIENLATELNWFINKNNTQGGLVYV